MISELKLFAVLSSSKIGIIWQSDQSALMHAFLVHVVKTLEKTGQHRRRLGARHGLYSL